MKKIILLSSIIAMIFVFQLLIVPKTYAADSISEAIQEADNFVHNSDPQINQQKLKDILDNIFNILAIIGVIIALIFGGVIGIKFMMASVEDKAKIKESLVPYIAGTAVIFGAYGIWKIFVTVFDSIA